MVDGIFQVVVVRAFAIDIRSRKINAQAVVESLAVGHGDVDKFLPLHQHVGVARLQLYHRPAAALLKVFIVIKTLLGFSIKVFQIRQGL